MPLRGEDTVNFELEYIPLKEGFATLGGLRVILLGDAEVDDPRDVDSTEGRRDLRVLKEWDIFGEVWIHNEHSAIS